MKIVSLDTIRIKDAETFHMEFKRIMGFPDFYGMNMDAWIDCMSDIEGGMLSEDLNSAEPLCIEVRGTKDFNERLPELMVELIECTSFVNQEMLRAKEDKYILIKFL